MSFIKKRIDAFNNEEFNELLIKRNLFIHNLAIKYINIQDGEKQLKSFIDRLSFLLKKYTKIFEGLLEYSFNYLSDGKIKISDKLDAKIELLAYLIKNNKQN